MKITRKKIRMKNTKKIGMEKSWTKETWKQNRMQNMEKKLNGKHGELKKSKTKTQKN